MDRSIARSLAAGVSLVVLLLAAGLVMPGWLLFLSTMAISHGAVSLGIVLLMRSGVVSFGQGFVFAAGGYAAAFAANFAGVNDALLLVLAGGLAAAALAAPFAPLLARYRGIFFAMLTLAISMVLYGVLLKSEALGGSDGFNVGRPALFGREIAAGDANFVLFTPPHGTDAKELWQRLLDRGVLVRDLTAVVPQGLRVTAGTTREVDLFLEAMEEVL